MRNELGFRFVSRETLFETDYELNIDIYTFSLRIFTFAQFFILWNISYIRSAFPYKCGSLSYFRSPNM
jgi:hypothetical protein